MSVGIDHDTAQFAVSSITQSLLQRLASSSFGVAATACDVLGLAARWLSPVKTESVLEGSRLCSWRLDADVTQKMA